MPLGGGDRNYLTNNCFKLYLSEKKERKIPALPSSPDRTIDPPPPDAWPVVHDTKDSIICILNEWKERRRALLRKSHGNVHDTKRHLHVKKRKERKAKIK